VHIYLDDMNLFTTMLNSIRAIKNKYMLGSRWGPLEANVSPADRWFNKRRCDGQRERCPINRVRESRTRAELKLNSFLWFFILVFADCSSGKTYGGYFEPGTLMQCDHATYLVSLPKAKAKLETTITMLDASLPPTAA